MTLRRLVLLANQYPFRNGDHVFIASEMPALAAKFDEVVVFNYAPGLSAEMVDLPSNVRFGGSLYGISRAEKIKALLSPANLSRLATVTFVEARTGRLSGHFRTFVAGTIAGMGLANDARLKDSLYEDGVQTTVYSFWGMGIGMLVPWIRGHVGSVNLRLHRYDLYEEEPVYLPFRPALFRRADRILAISESSRQYLLDKYPHQSLAEKITVRRLGSAAPLTSDEPMRQTVEVNTESSDDAAWTVVSCSYVIPVKRVARILDALEQLPMETSLKWIHFGGGALEAELRERAAALELARPELKVEVRGNTPHEEIMDYYRTHKIAAFINVSNSEGVPVSIMEAISYGIPVVATDVGGTAEIVGEALETGELIAADFTDEELAEKLLQVMSAAPGAYAPQELWARRYNAEVNAEATASLLAQRC
ncbi:glycosyltransferase [Arthrobacter antibioticus]|uniref:glycosyltransferase n=1 Tax=Arthrobacter sp. H35-MC1 TaxID=3046203 RepID=UPI0024B8954C|nr:glycosyltransferase [Arthrobacter sp. H35-MC1]MDJ0316465.1 glycosyltransferase [Arthrobacter sp. H35-MC1]